MAGERGGKSGAKTTTSRSGSARGSGAAASARGSAATASAAAAPIGKPSSPLAPSARSQARALDRLDASVAASTARLEQAFQGLAMRVELLESATEDAIRALRELQATVGGIPSGGGLDQAALDRWSAEQADAVTAVEKQLIGLATQMDSLRRRVPLKGRAERESVRLDDASVAAIARSVVGQLGVHAE